MEASNWYDYFMENIHEKFPKNAQLTQELIDLLCLEREAVYRRLRKDVVFHAPEVVKIASAWGISLDEIIGINSGAVAFQMQLLNFVNPSKKDFYNLQKRVSALDHLETAPYSEFMEICNRLPKPLCAGFPTLYRFYIFYWAYQYYQDEALKLFSKIIIPEKIVQQFENYYKNMLCVTDSHYILDQNIFEYLVYSIRYYHSIALVTDEEKELLKKELFSFIGYLEEIANKGRYPETQSKVNLYISKISVDTNYSYLFSDKLKICRIHAFGQYDIASSEPEMVNNFRKWMNLKKRSSIQISEANEKHRKEYFAKQREVVAEL